MSSEPAVRPAADGDADAIASLLNAHSDALYGEGIVTEALVAEWIGSEEIDVYVAEEDARIVCYGDVMLSPDGSRGDFDIRDLPGSPGGAAPMLRTLEHVARDRGASDARAFTDAREATYAPLLDSAGYRPVRHSFRMEIALGGDSAPAVWPAGVIPGTMIKGEEPAVHEAHQESFRDHWGFEEEALDRWLEEMIDTERFVRDLFFVARFGEEIAGVCLCALHTSGDPTHGWVRVLGVVPRWRRRGVGCGLLQHAFAELHRRGCTRAGLGVDAESTTGALELYERVGMYVHSRIDIVEKRLG